MDFLRLFDILPYQQKRFSKKICLAAKTRDGSSWHIFSTSEALRQIDEWSLGLLQNDFRAGDRIGILAHSGSPTFNLIDLAIQQIGAVPVPMHAASRLDELVFIFKDASLKACFVSNGAMLEKLNSANISSNIWSFEPIDGIKSIDQLFSVDDRDFSNELARSKEKINENDLATIVYTSGTTGEPKGAMLSHQNIVSNIKAVLAIAPVHEGSTAVSFLPLSHIFERMVAFSYMAAGTSVYYLDAKTLVLEDIRAVRPSFFTTVPRFLEKIHHDILVKKESMPAFIARLLDWAIAVGEQYPSSGVETMGPGYRIKLFIARLLVFGRWRKLLGGKIDGVFVGSAAMNPKLGRLFSAARIPIREGYGLTETSPVVAFNRFEPGGNHFGTVGIPAPGVDVRIFEPDENSVGEIQVKGPNVMQGYFGQPVATSEMFSEGRWLRTGDLGTFVHKRFLKITGRRKEVFKTSSGKFIAPQTVENRLLSSPFVAQAMAVGLARPFVAALIVPDFEALKIWCGANKVHWTSPQFMVLNPKVERLFRSVVEGANTDLANAEKVRAILLLHEYWSAETGEMTSTLKLKRAFLEEKHAKEIIDLYANGPQMGSSDEV